MVRSWLASSLGLAESGESVARGGLVRRFDPTALPCEPTRLGSAQLVPAAA